MTFADSRTRSFDAPFAIDSPTGARLNTYAEVPDAPRAVIIVAHGMVEHAGRYRRFAKVAAQHGFALYAHDHRGHGDTRAPDAPRGQFAAADGWRKVLADVKAVRDAATDAHPGLPVILFGHSMGGLVALNTVISYPDAFDAVACWNCNFNAGVGGRAAQVILAAERMLKGSDVPSGIIPRLTFDNWAKAVPDRKTEFDWLSHDEAEVAAYVADPHCGFDATVSMWRDIFTLIRRGADPRNWTGLRPDMPIHLLGGGEDPSTGNGRALAWLAERLRAKGFDRVTLDIEPGMRHETLNEIGAERPTENLLRWIDGAIGTTAKD